MMYLRGYASVNLEGIYKKKSESRLNNKTRKEYESRRFS